MNLGFYAINIAVGLALLFLMFKFTLVGLIGAFYSALVGITAQKEGITITQCAPIGPTLTCTSPIIESVNSGLPFAMMFLVFISYVLVKLAWGKGDED